MDPEHAYITLCLFFSRVEKNQKTEGRGEKPDGEGGRSRLLFSGRPAIRTGAAS